MKQRTRRIVTAALLAPPLLAAAALAAAYFAITHRTEGATFDSAGVPIHYTDEGTGTPVLLLHGFAVNADLNWRRPGITEALAREHRVISMDLRGHGLSGKPHDPAAYGRAMADDTARLLDHLGIEKAHIAGYSLGGFIALRFAALHPERTLTVGALGAGWERPEESCFLKALDRLANRLEHGGGVGPISAELDGERQRPTLLHTFWVWSMTRFFNDRLALIGVLKGIPELALSEPELRAIPVPVCAIVGEIDPLRTGAEQLRDTHPNTDLTVISGADHLRAPARPEFIAALSAFLAAHPPPNTGN